MLTQLLAAYPRGSAIEQEHSRVPCERNDTANAASAGFAGPAGSRSSRNILVKHADRRLELITPYVARRPDGVAALIDSGGHVYTGGLDDFRRNNELLAGDDLILAPRDLTDPRPPRGLERCPRPRFCDAYFALRSAVNEPAWRQIPDRDWTSYADAVVVASGHTAPDLPRWLGIGGRRPRRRGHRDLRRPARHPEEIIPNSRRDVNCEAIVTL